MEVYVEDVFLDNFIINFLILLITAKLLRIHIRYTRLLIASSVGVGFVLLNLIMPLQGVPLLLYKLGIGVIMCGIGFGEKTIKRNILVFLTFLFVTLLIGGGCFVLCFTFCSAVIGESGEVSYNLALPVGVVVGVIALVSFFVFQLVGVIKSKTARSNFVFNATIFHDNRSLSLKAFLDTGNTLVDPVTKKPVVVITYDFFKKINKDVQLQDILLARVPKGIKDGRFINVGSVGKSSKMLLVTMDAVKISQDKFCLMAEDVVFGITFAKIEQNLDCQMLISQDFLCERSVENLENFEVKGEIL